MYRELVVNVTEERNGEKVLKPVKFLTASAIEFHLGWNRTSIITLERNGFIPKTPISVKFGRTPTRLYLPEMIEELRELVEDHYPVFYRGRDVVLKQHYNQKREEYKQRAKELEDKWAREMQARLNAAPVSPEKRRTYAKRKPRRSGE